MGENIGSKCSFEGTGMGNRQLSDGAPVNNVANFMPEYPCQTMRQLRCCGCITARKEREKQRGRWPTTSELRFILELAQQSARDEDVTTGQSLVMLLSCIHMMSRDAFHGEENKQALRGATHECVDCVVVLEKMELKAVPA